VRGWRWHAIMRHGHVEHEPVDAYALVPVGYMGNTVLPARGGEVLRILLHSRRSSAKRREVLGTIVSERLLDAFSLALLFVALTWIGVADSPVGQRPALIALLILGALSVALQGYLMLRRRGHLERFAATVRPVARASRPLLGRWGAALCAVTLGVWCIEGVIFWLVAQSLELDVTVPEGLFLLVLTAFFSLIPAAPGYVGTFDAAVVFGLKAVGVVGGQAVAFALLVRFVLFVPITVAGLALLVTRYGGLRQLRRE
jgi:glycosyltransferase 2 family protein